MTTQESKLIAKFNRPDNIIIVSEYASRGRGGNGLSSFSKNTAKSLRYQFRKSGLRRSIIVLANITDEPQIYEERGILVIRCFKRGDIPSLFQIARFGAKLNRVESLFFEFEFASYGNLASTLAIPAVVFAFRAMGKRVVFLMHQVVADLGTLSAHLGLSQKSLKLKVLEVGLHTFYRFIGLICHRVVVLEEALRQRLVPYVRERKLMVIPHGIERTRPRKSRAHFRRKMGFGGRDFVIVSFGYVTWYKGMDQLIRAVDRLPRSINRRRIRLIIAGGRSPTQAGKPHYEGYYAQFLKLARRSARATFTGFVPDSDIAQYFAVADMVVLPYRTFISSSGPLSLALAYERPVVLSDALVDYIKSDDFGRSLAASGLAIGDLFVTISARNLERVIQKAMTDPLYRKRMREFVWVVKSRRMWYTMGQKYLDALTAQVPTRAYKFVLGYK